MAILIRIILGFILVAWIWRGLRLRRSKPAPVKPPESSSKSDTAEDLMYCDICTSYVSLSSECARQNCPKNPAQEINS